MNSDDPVERDGEIIEALFVEVNKVLDEVRRFGPTAERIIRAQGLRIEIQERLAKLDESADLYARAESIITGKLSAYARQLTREKTKPAQLAAEAELRAEAVKRWKKDSALSVIRLSRLLATKGVAGFTDQRRIANIIRPLHPRHAQK